MKERIIIERLPRGYRVTLVRDPMVQVEGEPTLTPAQLEGMTKVYDVDFLNEVTDLITKKMTRASEPVIERLFQPS